MADPLNLPAIEDARLKPCAGCGQPLGATFWMVRTIRCIVDGHAVKERVGLSVLMGSPALASLFASRPLAREFDALPEICVCETCTCSLPLAALCLKDPANG